MYSLVFVHRIDFEVSRVKVMRKSVVALWTRGHEVFTYFNNGEKGQRLAAAESESKSQLPLMGGAYLLLLRC